MRGNIFGKLFSITSFGESHGKALGVVIDGMPPNVAVNELDLQAFLMRRAPGRILGTTTRKEDDKAEILSGVLDGQTLGTPICAVVYNHGQRSQDYEAFKDVLRPGHADQSTLMKYGIRDHRGGGRSSGRETLARVIGGYFAQLVVPGVLVKSFVLQMGALYCQGDDYFNDAVTEYLLKCQQEGNSVGARVRLEVEGMPSALGEPCFDKMKADLAKALLSIGAVTSFSYGLGEEMVQATGLELAHRVQNLGEDPFGGIEGGITTGKNLMMTVTVKPPSTVGEMARQGRHDPCLVPRVLVVLESMVLIVIADHFLRQKAYSL